MKTELIPCPCCGNNAKPRQFRSGILKSRTVHYVECVVCRLRTSVELTPKGCAVAALMVAGLIQSIDETAVETFWTEFTVLMQKQGYIQEVP